ncbi:MAG: hypothetical protein ABI759_08115 [Candidatus Solibacter sp.]
MRRLAGPAILLVLTAAFYWKLTISREWTFLESPDTANVVRPWLDYQAREFHAGRLPLWDPYEWGGHTLIGQVQPGITNPLNWILFAMPLRDGHIPVLTLHWYWVLIHWLGALFCFALCRDLGAGFVSSLLGGCIFALAGFVGHTDWPQILMCSIWVPLVLLFFARVARGQTPAASGALCGAALGMAFLSGYHVVPTFTAVLLGAMWLGYVAIGWRQRARWGHAALWLCVWLLVSAVQVLPAVEYAKQSLRWAGAPEPLRWGQPVPYDVHAQYSLGWPSVAGIVLPGISLHANPHVGFVAVGLALAALWRRRRDAQVRWFGCVALGGLLLALGKDFPLYWLIYRFVPMVEKAREPAMAIVLCQVGVAALAALGASLVERLGGRSGWSLAALGLTVFLAEAVYAAPRLARFDRRDSYAAMLESQADVAVFLKAQAGWFRVDIDESDLSYNFGDFHGIEQFGGVGSSLPIRTHKLLGHAETPRLFGVRYRVARVPSDPAQEEVFRSRSGLRVYRDPRIGEALWTWHETPCAAKDQLRIVDRTSMAVKVEVEMGCPGLAVVGDAFYPGWRALLDGERRPVQEVEAVRAVRTGAGRHVIEFRYRPASVYWGFGLTMLGLLVACIAQTGAIRKAKR